MSKYAVLPFVVLLALPLIAAATDAAPTTPEACLARLGSRPRKSRTTGRPVLVDVYTDCVRAVLGA